jgi:hypothetical protein
MSVVVGLVIRSKIQSLAAFESACNKSPEEDNGGGAGLVSRARMPLKLNPRKKGFTRIPPVLADTTSRPARHALRRRTHGGRSKGLTPTTKYIKRKPQKHEIINKQTSKNPRIYFITPHSARTRACFLERGAAFFPSFPQLSGEY